MFITNLINKYFISTRSYLSTGILFILLTSSSIAYTQNDGKLDIWFSLFCFTIIFQNFCLAYLLNSYLDSMCGSDYIKKELDSTLFKHITINQLRGFIKIPLILNIVLLIITWRWKGVNAFLIISLLDLLQIIGVCLYTPSKYLAFSHLVFSFVHYINIWIFYYSNTLKLPSLKLLFEYFISGGGDGGDDGDGSSGTDSTISSTTTIDIPFIYYSIYFLPVILQSIHANYHRDIENDKKAGILTIAILFGGLVYLIFLMLKFNNIFFLLPFATIPLMNELYNNRNDLNFINIQTSKIHFFSLFLFSLAILLGGKKYI